jgi:GNAT superfamily N-acetyltransferase
MTEVRLMRPEEAPAVSAMVSEAFQQSLGPGQSEEARQEFLTYTAPDQLLERSRRGNQILIAEVEGRIAGTLEVRPPSHVAQLFIAASYQGQGIAQALVDAAFPDSLTASGLTVTVNAPPEAVTTYARLGFRVIAAEQMRNGVRFVPMTRNYGPVFFPVSLTKFAVMCLASLGIYQFAWIYWNWRYERRRTADDVSPFWRTFFTPLYLHSLFNRMRRAADQEGVPVRWNVGLLVIVTALFWVTVFFQPPWPLVSLFAYLPTIAVQRTVNALNRRVAPHSPRNAGFTVGNIILILFGGVIFAVLIWGMFYTPGSVETNPGAVAV